MKSKKKINVGISKTDIGYFVDLHHTIIAGSYSPVNTALKDYTTDVETLNYALKPLNLEIVEKQSNPTFEQCIKEWEDRGWEVYVSNREIELLETNSLNTISIDKRDKCYWCNYYLSFELHHLLSKTIKVLEEMKDE